MAHDLVIAGGTLITAEQIRSADIGIQGGVIREIGENLSGTEIVDARGLYVVPGGVDPHVHLQMPQGDVYSSDDWRSGTKAAVCGGTTTLIDFVEPEADETMLEALEARRAEADGFSVTDYSLHMTITTAMMQRLEDIPAVVDAGIPSFKLYTTYDGMMLDDYQLLEAMSAAAAAGGMVLVHSENDAVARFHTEALLEAGQRGPDAHPLARPASAEEEAIQRVLILAETAGVPVYIVHISTAGGADAVAAANAAGQAAFGETCPQYLLLGEDLYSTGFEGAKYVCTPPLRSEKHRLSLWSHLSTSSLHTIGTDHCPFNYEGQKDLGRENFTKIPGGMPGVQLRTALMHTYGVLQGRLTLNEWVQLCSTQPARIFGLHPRKGALQPGSDADIVLFDPGIRSTITRDSLSENVDYTPYEGLELTGAPVQVYLKGHLAARNGEFLGTDTPGCFLERQRIGQEDV